MNLPLRLPLLNGPLSDAEIKEFQEIYKKEFGEDLDHQEAMVLAMNLIRFCKITGRPLPGTKESGEAAAA